MRALFINGKFCAQRLTGVQRVALQHVLAIDAWLARVARGQASTDEAAWSASLGSVTLLCPHGAPSLELAQVQQRWVGPPDLPLHLWEQAVLPWCARRGRLLSLAGSAPWWARAPSVVLHDAALWDCPQGYRPLFVHWYRALWGRQSRVAAPLFTVSAFSRDRLAAWLAIPPGTLHVVPNGADHLDAVKPDTDILQQNGLRAGEFLLAVGSANPSKNLDALVRAHRRWEAASAPRLVIVGGRNSLVFRATGTHGLLHENVLELGVVDDGSLKALYQHALGLVFPSLYEGFGLPPLEAMRAGCPVLVARTASLPEVCGDAALYFDPQDEASLLQAMIGLCSDAQLRERLRARGLARAAAYRWRESAMALVRTLAFVGSAPEGGSA